MLKEKNSTLRIILSWRKKKQFQYKIYFWDNFGNFCSKESHPFIFGSETLEPLTLEPF